MNACTVLLGVLFCLITVNARHYVPESEMEGVYDEQNDQIDNVKRARDYSAGQMRHRRKRWQTSYGYNYPPPSYPYYPDDRRDYDRNHQDLLPHILRLLDEISTYVKRPQPPPPPQTIYVPYPVPYPVPQYCSCRDTKTPNITGRFPEMEDTNQNWGFVADDKDDDDDSDGVRPISFDPIKPKRPTTRPPPAVEHGSSQAVASPEGRIPTVTVDACDAAILSCCRPSDSRQQQRKCFNDLNCGSVFASGNACKPDMISSALDKFSKTYSPVN